VGLLAGIIVFEKIMHPPFPRSRSDRGKGGCVYFSKTILPASLASKTAVNGTLKAQIVSGAFVRSGRRTLPVLMIAELALTLVLTIGAGLLSRSFLQMVAVSNGFNSAGLTSFLPLAQASLDATFQVEDHTPVDPGKMPYVYLNHVS
jgi:hypothetical protein